MSKLARIVIHCRMYPAEAVSIFVVSALFLGVLSFLVWKASFLQMNSSHINSMVAQLQTDEFHKIQYYKEVEL